MRSPLPFRVQTPDHRQTQTTVHSVAYRQLVTFNQRSSELRDVLIRLLDHGHDGTSDLGLQLALFAFSSLHRGSPQHAAQFKMLSLSALTTSSRKFSQDDVTVTDAIFHVAACMLLCSYEVSLPCAVLWVTRRG